MARHSEQRARAPRANSVERGSAPDASPWDMSSKEDRGLTRRELLALAATGAAGAALVGCAPTIALPTPPATPTAATPFAWTGAASLYADGTIPRALAVAAGQRLASQAIAPGVRLAASLDERPDLVLSFGSMPPGYTAVAVGTSPLAVLTHLRVPLDHVTGAQALALLGGDTADWSDLGAPYGLPAHVYTLADLPLPSGMALAGNASVAATAADLLARLRAVPGSLALAPVDLADWSVRDLGVDGYYPVQGRGAPGPDAFAPATLRLGVAVAHTRRGLDPAPLVTALAPLLAAATPNFDMLVAGDIILGRGTLAKMWEYNDYLYPYRHVRDEFLTADWRVANLECTISDLVPVPTDPFTFTFIAPKPAVNGLVFAGIQTVTVANNHADNGGTVAFMDMLSSLKAHGIRYCGGGANLAEARRPTIQTVKGVRVALLGYDDIPPGGPFADPNGPGIAPIDLTTLAEDLRAARAKADLVIPYFHWGIEYTEVPTEYQQRIARAAIDAGADMVLGSHPHWVQSIESYKGRLIVYSLANFVFDQDWSRETLEGFMLHLYWRGTTLASIRFVPTLIHDRCQPWIMSPAEAVGVFHRMWAGTDLLERPYHTPGDF